MDKQKLYSIMDDAMQVLTQTDVWDDIERSDPYIQQARRQFDAAVAQAEKHCGKSLCCDIEEASATMMSAYCDAGILYGIQIALAIREAALNPCEFSQHVLDRIAGKREEVTA